MSHAIAQIRPSAPVLTPTTFDQLVKFSEIAATSGLVPKDFVNKPGAIMIAVQMGSELGLSPMQSLQSIAVINGRPGVWGDGLIGLCRASPLCEDIQETIDGEGDARVAVCIARRRGAAPVEGRFSVADAKRAGLWGKAIWAAYPERMLRNRARGFALRDAFPDVLRGLKTGEELLDTPGDDFRGTTIDAPAQVSGLAQANAEHRTAQREAAQAAAVTPPPKGQTVKDFLDQLDKELDLAPESSLVHALMMSERVTNARSFMTGTAGERLSAWTIRAGQKRAALLAAEQHADKAAAAGWKDATIAPEQSGQSAEPETIPTDPLNATMPEDIDAWPLAGEEMANG